MPTTLHPTTLDALNAAFAREFGATPRLRFLSDQLVTGAFDPTGEFAEALCDLTIDADQRCVVAAIDLDRGVSLTRDEFMRLAREGEEDRLVTMAEDRDC